MVLITYGSTMDGQDQAAEQSLEMGVPHITSFCWCLGLETGAKVVGIAHLLASVTLIIVCSVFASDANGYVGTVEDAGDHLYSIWFKILVSGIVASAVHFCLACTLLISIHKRNTSGLRVWVWLMLVLASAALLFVVVSMAMHGMSGSGSDIFLSFLEGLLFFGILSYCILCVYSYYLMLKSSEDMEGPKSDY